MIQSEDTGLTHKGLRRPSLQTLTINKLGLRIVHGRGFIFGLISTITVLSIAWIATTHYSTTLIVERNASVEFAPREGGTLEEREVIINVSSTHGVSNNNANNKEVSYKQQGSRSTFNNSDHTTLSAQYDRLNRNTSVLNINNESDRVPQDNQSDHSHNTDLLHDPVIAGWLDELRKPITELQVTRNSMGGISVKADRQWHSATFAKRHADGHIERTETQIQPRGQLVLGENF